MRQGAPEVKGERDPEEASVTEEDGANDGLLFQQDQVVAERYRTLAWMLDQSREQRGCQVITITSSGPGEGKSTLSLNLAAVLSERAPNRTVVLELDMRCPTLSETLTVKEPGIDAVLSGRVKLEDALRFSERWQFAYVPVTHPVEDPLKLLADTNGLKKTITDARACFDYVLLDAPPVLPVSDPLFLAEESDGILFVVRAGETSGRMIDRAIAVLPREKILGLVFNGTAQTSNYYYSAYYGHGAKYSRSGRKKHRRKSGH